MRVGFSITEVDRAEAERTLAVPRAMAGVVETELGEPLPGQGRSAPADARAAPREIGPHARG